MDRGLWDIISLRHSSMMRTHLRSTVVVSSAWAKLMITNIVVYVTIYFASPTLLLFFYRYGLFHTGLIKELNLKYNLKIIAIANFLNFSLLFSIYLFYAICQLFDVYFLMTIISVSGYFFEMIGMSFDPHNIMGSIIKLYSLFYIFVIIPIIYFALSPFIIWKFNQ